MYEKSTWKSVIFVENIIDIMSASLYVQMFELKNW